MSKRGFALSLSSALLLSFSGKTGGNCGALAAVLEAEDDLELLEKVKQDRKKRIERQAIINSSKKETGLSLVFFSSLKLSMTQLILYLMACGVSCLC